MTKGVRLTGRELDVMSVLWRRQNGTVAEIRDGLSDDLAYPTVQTMLRILEAKGYVGHTQDGRAFRFHALVDRDQAANTVLRRLVSKVYQGSREMLVSQLLADEKIPAAELRRIKTMLQRRIAKADDR